MSLTRRQFLLGATATSLGFGGLYRLIQQRGYAAQDFKHVPYGFGPLSPDPGDILDLPPGFKYKIFSRTGDVMHDGLLVPANHDGMAAFSAPDGLTLLIRNHEIENQAKDPSGPFGANLELLAKADPQRIFDLGGGRMPSNGGTTTLLFDTKTQELREQRLSLTGTVRNCAGGRTPWNSWLTCEETEQQKGEGYAEDHGWVFDVPADISAGLIKPKPLKALGRFYHEAVAIDPATGIVYLSEDKADGLLYRFIPTNKGDLSAGRLQALKIKNQPGYDLRNWGAKKNQPPANPIIPGKSFPVEWIDMEDIESPRNDLRHRGFTAGAARFARMEGMYYGEGIIYAACTSGGYAFGGQIWKYTPSPAEGAAGESASPGKLELFIEPNDRGIIDMCDNICVAPWGDLILCEDGDDEQFLVGVTPAGEIYKFARNAMNHKEFAGATFSPDGSTLFVNIQSPGLTLAITGPWQKKA